MKTTEKKDAITYEEFARADIRAGRIKDAYFLHSDISAYTYRVIIDFGQIGTKKGILELDDSYNREELEGRLVIALLNLLSDEENEVETIVLKIAVPSGKDVLIKPDWEVPLGCRVL